MSAILRCDVCRRMIDGSDVMTPRLCEDGDIRPPLQEGSGSMVLGLHRTKPDPVRSDKVVIAEARRGVPGYTLKRRAGQRDDYLTQIWVTWRPEEDICRDCVEDAIVESAKEIERRREARA